MHAKTASEGGGGGGRADLQVVVVLRVDRAQQQPGGHVARLTMHLGLHCQHRLGQQPAAEQLAPAREAARVLRGRPADAV